MRFKLWLELASLENLPDIELNKVGKGSYDVNFDYKGDSFTIDINQTSEPWGGTEIEDIYSVVFSGPSGVRLAKKYSLQEANEIYNYLIAALFKLDKTIPNLKGFEFFGTSSEQDIMYDMLYKRYLKPNGFIRFGSMYIKKPYLEKLIAKHQDGSDVAKDEIEETERQWLKHIDFSRQRKNIARAKMFLMDKLKNKFVKLFPPIGKSIGFVTGSTDSANLDVVIVLNNVIQTKKLDVSNLTWKNEPEFPTQEEVEGFKKEFMSAENYENLKNNPSIHFILGAK